MSLKIRNIILNAQDVKKVKTFWQAALGLKVLEESEGWAYLGDSEKDTVRLGLQQTDMPKSEFNRLHLDLEPEDAPAEVERLKSLGATIIAWKYGPDPAYLVMTDPEGNEFCVVGDLENYRIKL